MLDLSEIAALLRSRPAAAAYPTRQELRAAFLKSAAAHTMNPAAIAYHGADNEHELRDALASVFLPETMDTLADAATALIRGSGGSEAETTLGRLHDPPVRARARLDALATTPNSLCVVMTLLPLVRHSNLLEVIPDLLFELNSSGVYVDYAAPADSTASRASDFLGKSITETMPADVADRALAALQRLRIHGGTERLEYALTKSDGLHWYEARMVGLPSGGATACVRDITDRKGAEWRLQESDARFRTMADSAPVLLWISDQRGARTYFNKVWFEFTGSTLDRERGDGWLERIHPEDVQRYTLQAQASRSARVSFRAEYRLKHRDGEYRWLLDHGTPRFSAENELLGFIGSCIDITELKTSQAELDNRVRARTQELEIANRELEAFGYSVAHDLRTPLRVIRGFSKLIVERQSQGLDIENSHYFERVHAAALHMDRLIDDLLRLSHVSRARLENTSVNVSLLAAEIIERLRHADPHREVQVTIRPDITLTGDGRLLGILLDNLLGNAWKFTSARSGAQIDVGLRDANVCCVRDNGAGFDAHHADRLFRPFQRLHPLEQFEGTGIGLAIAHRIVERHGGKIWATGAANEGAEFCFQLTAAAAGSLPHEEKTASEFHS